MKRLFSIGFSALIFGTCAVAQSTVSTDPVGFVNVTVPAQSDAVLAVPLHRAAAFKGKIQAISGNTITVAGTPDWIANQFVQSLPSQTDTFSVLIANGVKEGLIARVISNTANQVTIEVPTGDDLTGVKTNAVDGAGEGDEVDVMPYWTAASLFPAGLANLTELFAFDNSTPGRNVSPSVLLQFYAGYGWFETVSYTEQSHRPLLFGTAFILRNNAAAPLATSVVGLVPMSKHRYTLRTLAANLGQDQSIGFSSPVPEKLSEVNLGAQNFDELFLYNNSAIGKNKAPTQLLIHHSGRWYESITFTDVTDQITLQPGGGMIYRLAASAQPTQFVWQQLQSYLIDNSP